MGDGVSVGIAGLLVKDLCMYLESAGCQPLHEWVVHRSALADMPGCKRLDEDGICIEIVCNHYVLVATARPDGEMASVISEEFAEQDHQEVEFIGHAVAELYGRGERRCIIVCHIGLLGMS